jgi:hypothetical protein
VNSRLSVFLLALCATLVCTATCAAEEGLNPMWLGVDDAGSEAPIWNDEAAQDAFAQIGFDFLSHKMSGPIEGRTVLDHVARLDAWARSAHARYLLNLDGAEVTPGNPAKYDRPGAFAQPGPDLIKACVASPRFMGIIYDELAHWVLDGAWPTIQTGKYAPYFYDAKGRSLFEAYEGNFRNASVLMDTLDAGFKAHAKKREMPVIGAEYVFPILHHLFARAGFVPIPKYLKESIAPVHAAVALGAAKQYNLPYWACLDLWFHLRPYPGHEPKDLESALLFAYWTGAQSAYVENFAYNRSLYSVEEGPPRLSALGETVREFKHGYLPFHPRRVDAKTFAPEIIVVRFPDSDWGQEKTGAWITGWLYGAENLLPDKQTRYWVDIWHVLTHGELPRVALNYNNLQMGDRFRFLWPANNVAVYDHLAADPTLYASARLVLLTGKAVSAGCLKTLKNLVSREGLTVVVPSHLAPEDLTLPEDEVYRLHKVGLGRWIVTDNVTDPSVVALIKPFLGSSSQMRYVFGNREVTFSATNEEKPVEVKIRPLS